MNSVLDSRRKFLKAVAGAATGALTISSAIGQTPKMDGSASEHAESSRADYTLRIGATHKEVADRRTALVGNYAMRPCTFLSAC